MFRLDRAEVAAVQGDDHIRIESFSKCNDRGIRSTQREVGVLLNQLGDALPIIGMRNFDVELTQAAQESSFSSRASPLLNEIRRLSNHHRRDNEPKIRPSEDGGAARVIAVVLVGGRYQSTGVNDR